MQSIINTLLNAIFVSMPEELFFVVVVLVLLKQDDFLDIIMWRKNLKWISIPVLSVSIMMSVSRYMLELSKLTMLLSSIIMLTFLIDFIIIKNGGEIAVKSIFKTMMCVILGIIFLMTIESTFYPVLLSLLHKPITYFNDIVFYNILLAIPTRVALLCIIAFIIMKKNAIIQVNLFNSIIKNKLFSSGLLTIILFVISIATYIVKLVHSENILINLNMTEQLIIIMMVTTIPVILVSWILIFISCLLTKEKRKQKVYENILNKNDDDFNINEDEDGYY